MSNILIPIKSFLGKYYSELNYSSIQDKYSGTKIDTIFDQRFLIQSNKAQMIIDPSLDGLIVTISGNEIQISKQLYDHPSVAVTNSLENKDQATNPRSLYNPETFSTLAYLVCQNHTMFQITGEMDEPIYVRYKSDFESFYNSIVVFEIGPGLGIEVVEEIESFGALNSVTNYVLQDSSNLKLLTIYNNNKSAISFVYRNIIARENSKFFHKLMGKGSSNVLDENKIIHAPGSKSEFLGIVKSNGQNFHSVLSVYPETMDYSVVVSYKDILMGKADVTFFPVVVGLDASPDSSISVSDIEIDELNDKTAIEIHTYIEDLVDRMVLDRIAGSVRFYDYKSKFLKLP